MTHYLNSLAHWVQTNPEWAIFFTFFIAFSESIIVIGTLIPGSITMTAIGILAGSGVMRIDLTLTAAILGAIAGDFGSYLIGHVFSNRIPNIWPFSKYPHWINYTKDYFTKHGGKSVFFGRFIGPIRAIIPVVAGMMHMNHWQFLIANVASAIGWALVHIMPGYIIGAASIELADGSTKRLIILLLIFIIAFYILIRIARFFYRHSKTALYKFIISSWNFAKQHPLARYYMKILAPKHERAHHRTVKLLLGFVFFLTLGVVVYWLVVKNSEVLTFNYAVYLIGQSFNANIVNNIFIIFSFFINNLSLLSMLVVTAVILAIYKDVRTLVYWIGIFITSGVVFLLLGHALPQLDKVFHETSLVYNPALNITIITSCIGFLFALTHQKKQKPIITSMRFIYILLLVLGAIASIYLGDISISNVIEAIIIGTTIAIGYWIFYRRHLKPQERLTSKIIVYLLGILLLSACTYFVFYFDTIKKMHFTNQEQVILHKNWWSKTPLLFYATNLIGTQEELLNIQYLGSIEALHHCLLNYNWKEESSSLLFNLFLSASGQSQRGNLTYATRFFHNKKPVLTLTYNKNFVFQLWSSHYIINKNDSPIQKPLWVGIFYSTHPENDTENTFEIIKKACTDFNFLPIKLHNKTVWLIDE